MTHFCVYFGFQLECTVAEAGREKGGKYRTRHIALDLGVRDDK